MMNEERVREVFSDEEFVKSLFELETPAEVCAALKEKGIEMSEDDVLKIKDLLIKQMDGELSDEELEDVAGGLPVGVIPIIAAVAAAGVGLMISYIKTRRW